MADDVENDDQWLYGDGGENINPEEANQDHPESLEKENNLVDPEEKDETDASKSKDVNDVSKESDDPQKEVQQNGNVESSDQIVDEDAEKGEDEEDEDEDSDDDINVVIGDIKPTTTSFGTVASVPGATAHNVKRGGLLTSTAIDKTKQQMQQQSGRFTVEEFEQVGTINGIPAIDYSIEAVEDRPWRKPGADITDYFNYGFNEDTWKAYCERQRRMRVNESGVGLVPLNAIGMPRTIVALSDNNGIGQTAGSQQAAVPASIPFTGGIPRTKMSLPPPTVMRRVDGTNQPISGGTQIGATGLGGGTDITTNAPKENVIQVMTADRREYSRKPPLPDISLPPPNFEEFQPEFGFNPEPEPFYGGYEPTQDSQWGAAANPNWPPTEIKPIPGEGPPQPPPVPMVPQPIVIPPMGAIGPSPVPAVNSVIMPHPHMGMPAMPPPSGHHSGRSYSRSPSRVRSERSRSRSRGRSEKPRDRDRERSHRRERSRSRSRRHKSRSRSRSPSHRSHRKKKSRRHEDSD